jgi:hypothetical protein
MPTKIKRFIDTSRNTDKLEQTCPDFIADLEAAGGSLIQTAFSNTQWDERFMQLCVMVTYVEGIGAGGLMAETVESELVEDVAPIPKAFGELDL